MRAKCLFHRSDVNEKCPDIVIEYYESRCPINQKYENDARFVTKYEEDALDNPPPAIVDNTDEPAPIETKATIDDDAAATATADGQSVVQESQPYPEESEKTANNGDSDVVNAAFSINVDDTNSVQVSYSLPLIENQPGEELMDTSEQARDTSDCHMPELQEMQ